MLYLEATREQALACFPTGGTLVEVGVFKGTFSREIVDIVRPDRLHLVDVWRWTYFDWNDPPASELKSVETFKAWAKTIDPEYDGGHPDAMLERFYRNIAAWSETERRSKITLHRGRSVEIAREFPDEHFDLIYIDADHHYDTVLADLAAYAPKLKRGGIIMGDDFLEDLSRTDGLYGTIDAVNTFIKRTDFKPLAITGPGACQFVLRREMSPYVDAFLSRLLNTTNHLVEINDALLSRFVQKTIRTSSTSKYVPSFS